MIFFPTTRLFLILTMLYNHSLFLGNIFLFISQKESNGQLKNTSVKQCLSQGHYINISWRTECLQLSDKQP